MNIHNKQVEKGIIDIIDEELKISKESISITVINAIPDTNRIPLDKETHWIKIKNVICVFIDMIGSTKLSAENHDKTTAKTYKLFTESMVKIFHYYESPYIDIKGDGVFALYNSNQVYRALVSAVTAKTVIENEIAPRIKILTGLDIGAHIGIDQKTVLVKRIGFRRISGRTDRQNEVWAGKTINMAAKLASLSKAGELIVSGRYYENLKSDLARKSCGCPNGAKVDLWSLVDTTHDNKFDFNTAYKLSSRWCGKHGTEFLAQLLKLDQ